MQPGSLVIAIKKCEVNNYLAREAGMKTIAKGEILTVNRIVDGVDREGNPVAPNLLLIFEEKPVKASPSGHLFGYERTYFKEIQPPFDTAKLLQDEKIEGVVVH